MSKELIEYCTYCENLGSSKLDNGRTCIRCLRETIDAQVDKLEEPEHFYYTEA